MLLFDYLIFMPSDWEKQIKAQIKMRYASQALGIKRSGNASAVKDGYPAELIANLPNRLTANYSGCGYIFSNLKFSGSETIINLGAGAGLDSFIAAQQVPNGLVISVDITFEMLLNFNQKNIYNLCADIEYLPVDDSCADIIIANASLNLTISKKAAFKEAFRSLKKGGRLIARDLIKIEDLPVEVLTDPLSCNTSLGGVLKEDALIAALEKAGFEDTIISDHRPFSYVHSILIEATKPY
jgi:SAM-dependent methyltransferase